MKRLLMFLFALTMLCFSANTASAEEIDVVVTNDGQTYRGKILRELNDGLLFRTLDEKTITIKFTDIKDIKKLTEEKKKPEGTHVEVKPVISPTMKQETKVEVHTGAAGPPPYAEKLKSRTGAFALSVLYPGFGQLYARKWGWGGVYGATASLNLLLNVLTDKCDARECENSRPNFELGIGLHIGLVLASAIHAAIQTGAHNRRIVDEYESSAATGLKLRQLGYTPVATDDGLLHLLSIGGTF